MKFKEVCHKIAAVLEKIIGFSFGVCLFVGGLGFLVYVVAFCVGGEAGELIATTLYKQFYGTLIKISTITTLVTFLMIYLKGDANWVNPFKREKKA